MLNANEFTYQQFKDNRVKLLPEFTEGMSGSLLLATHKKTGERYIVKHTYPHNAANEYVACWLAEKLGVPAPTALLLSPNRLFSSQYAVAISYIDDLTGFDKTKVPANLHNDLIGQFTLNILIANDDKLQLGMAGRHIYSYDFSEAFNVSDDLLYQAFCFNNNLGISLIKQKIDSFRDYLDHVDFDIPGLALEFNLDPKRQQSGMIETAERVLDIKEDEIEALAYELMKAYPVGYIKYYKECLRAIHNLVNRMSQE